MPDVVERWVKYGILDENEINKDILVNSYECIYQHLTNLESKNEEANCIIFPVLKRILTKIDIKPDNINDFIIELYDDFLQFFIKFRKEIISKYDYIYTSDIDYEVAVLFCDDFIEKYNSKNEKTI